MPGGGVPLPIRGTDNVNMIEAPVTLRGIIACALAAFGGLFFGYDTGWMSGVLGMPYFISLYTGYEYDYEAKHAIGIPDSQFVIPSHMKSLMTGILSAGTFVGALAAGDLADKVGRRPSLLLGCLIFTAGCVLEIASTAQAVMFVAGRCVAGLGVGFISSVIILYLAEVSPRRYRGRVLSAYQFCITIGLLASNCICKATQNLADTRSYRIPVGIQFVWALLLAAGLLVLPESARYYVMKNDLYRAKNALCRIRAQPEDSEYIEDELAEVMAHWDQEKSALPEGYWNQWAACFKGGLSSASSPLRRTLLGMGLQACQQLTGINFIFYFGVTFFQQLGNIRDPFLMSLVTTAVNVVSTCISFVTMDRFGRRPVLLCGAVGMLVSQFLIGVIGITVGRPEFGNQNAVKAMIALICINISFFASTWGPGAWVVMGESFNLPIRSRGIGISTATNWLFNFLIATVTPYMVGDDPNSANLGPRVFLIWAAFCALSWVFTYFLVPELKGLTLEQVDQVLESTTPRKTPGWIPTVTFATETGNTRASTGVFDEVEMEPRSDKSMGVDGTSNDWRQQQPRDDYGLQRKDSAVIEAGHRIQQLEDGRHV